jgi:PAS domain S-box-containing protein
MQQPKSNYPHRSKKLEEYHILDTLSEPEFDRLTQLAALICETPISLITILTDKKQWFKSKVGLDIDSTPIEHAFCNHAIRQSDIFEIPDATKDERFAENPLVTSAPDIRFYAGYPLLDKNGFALGTLCVIDKQPRRLTEHQRQALRLLAQEAMDVIRLRAYKETYEEFFELVPEMLCMVDMQGNFMQVNPAWENVLHYKSEELIGRNVLSLIHPDDIAPTKAALAMLGNGQTVTGFVNRYRSRDGSYRSLEWNSRAVGKLIFASSKDVTKELKARENMQRSEERYRMLTELVSDYVYAARIEGDQLYLEWVSDNVQRILGYSFEELRVPGTWESIVWPEDAQRIIRGKNRLHDSEEKINEYRVTTKAGEVRWMRDYNRIVRRESDTKGYIIGATKDITTEKKAEIALLHTKDLLEQTGRAARIGTWEFDVIHQQLIWSDVTRMLHEVPLSFQPDVATDINFYKEGESRQKITEALNKAISEGVAFDMELELLTATNRAIWVRAIGIPEWQNGRCVRVYGAFQDIDEQKKIQIALQKSEQALLERNKQLEQLIELTKRQNERLKEYTYITSHNLRSSVANILSLSDLLYTMPNDAELLNMLQSATRQLDSTIFKMNTLLDVDSMAETNEKEPVNLLDAIRENLELLRNRRTDDTKVSVTVPPQLTVAALPAYIDSILHNLLSNAMKYSRPDTPCQIDIQAYEEGDFVVIAVADNGVGIDLMKNGDKLFRMSSRLHTDKEGKGLGLFLTKYQIETMGGSIEVESTPGKGSVFRVYLPKT